MIPAAASMKPGFRERSVGALAFLIALSIGAVARAQEHVATAHHDFGDVARWAKVFEAPERARWQKPGEVVRALELKPGDKVADIGAGTGYFTRRFAAAVAPSGEALGLDVEPAMVAYMKADAKKRKVKNYHARVVKADDPELAPHSVDLVFFCDTLHHMHDRVAYFRKLAPALRPGGRVAVIDFKKEPLPVGPPVAEKLARGKVIAEFRAGGFRMVAHHDFLPYQYFLEFVPAGAAN
jgi:ubiquinone/menaquinone biosynthesis C-methylase UbiE